MRILRLILLFALPVIFASLAVFEAVTYVLFGIHFNDDQINRAFLGVMISIPLFFAAGFIAIDIWEDL